MTYATELGFVVGEKYKINSNNCRFTKSGDTVTFSFDDETTYPEFTREDGFRFYCDLGAFESPKTKNSPSPRYHKKRKKPPIRKKTDATFHYGNGKQYTIKNVNYVFALHGDYVKVEYKEKGIEKTVKVSWKNNPFSVRIKSPDMTTSLYYGEEDFEGEVLFLSTGKELSWTGDIYEQNF